MIKSEWAQRIKAACKDAGTYKPYFDSVIDTLAWTMAARDDAQRELDAEGITVERTRGGSVTTIKNPAMSVIRACNMCGLAYWRDLGLTPAGFKRVSGTIKQDDGKKTFEEFLSDLGPL